VVSTLLTDNLTTLSITPDQRLSMATKRLN